MKKFFNKIVSVNLSFFLMIFLYLYLRLLGFGRLLYFLKKNRSNLLHIDNIGYVSKSIELICIILPNISCLVRASVLKAIFSEIKSLKLIIGININKEKLFKSHAWITYKKKIILNNDSKIDSYKVIHTI